MRKTKLLTILVLIFISLQNANGQCDSSGLAYQQFELMVNEFYLQRKFEKIIHHGDSVLLELKKKCKKDPFDLGLFLNDIAMCYKSLGKFEKAYNLMNKSLKAIEASYGKEHSNYETTLLNMSDIAHSIGRLEAALKYKKESVSLSKKLYGENSINYALSVASLPTIYKDLGFLEEALAWNEIAENILKEKKEYHYEYAVILLDKASILTQIGLYEEAMPIAHKARDLLSIQTEVGIQNYIRCLDHLALNYIEVFQFEEALKLLEEAHEISLATYGKEGHDYLTSLNNLGVLALYMEEYEKALRLLNEAIDLTKKFQGKNHHQYGSTLHNLANAKEKTGQVKKAVNIQKKAIKIIRKTKGEKNEHYLTPLSNLALFYETLRAYKKASQLHLKGIRLTEDIAGEQHKNYGSRLSRYGKFQEARGNLIHASYYFKLFVKNRTHLLSNQIHYTSRTLKENWLKESYHTSNTLQSFCLRNRDTSLLNQALSYQILLDNFQLESRKQFNKAIKHADSTTKANFESWTNTQKYIIRQKTLPITDRSPNLDSISDLSEKLEAQLMANSKELSNTLAQVSLNDVQQSIKEKNELFVFFNSFTYRDITDVETDSILYVAYLISAEKAEMVYLFEQRQLDSLTSIVQNGNMYKSRGIKPLKKKFASEQLYNLIWKPLLPHLQNVDKLYLHPSGSLHKINLGTIPIDSTSRISDQYKISYISSFKNYILSNDDAYKNTALLLGGLNYDHAHNSIDSIKNYFYQDINRLKLNRGLEENRWEYLLGTKIETDTISQMLIDNKFSTTYLKNSFGTESFIKQFDGEITSPRILHIATHGYFFPVNSESMGTKTAYRISEDPLIRTGLILAGANLAWQGQSPAPNQEDGILTAYEISLLDLSDTELVVLSACETGLGDIQGAEGVYGLQRGFKMAGVKYIIMSLWKVPDFETQELMTLFYQKWLEDKMTIPDAFRAAQNEMRKKYEAEPYKWAGFILVE